ncbi:MAG: universal stress protein [Chloroflexota bacterium]
MIVISTHDQSGIDRLWVGSVAIRVTQIADLPVLLV